MTFLSYIKDSKNKTDMSHDITKNEVHDDAKNKALNIISGALELAGLDPRDYDLNLRKKSQPKAAPNIQVFQTAAYLAATTLSAPASKIFLYFLSISEFENYVDVYHQETIAEEVNLSLRHTIRGLKELEDNGVIIKTISRSDKRKREYFLNPMSAWKGKTLNRKIALQKAHMQDKDQLHLFGETYEDNVIREAEEIKAKRPNLFLTGGK